MNTARRALIVAAAVGSVAAIGTSCAEASNLAASVCPVGIDRDLNVNEIQVFSENHAVNAAIQRQKRYACAVGQLVAGSEAAHMRKHDGSLGSHVARPWIRLERRVSVGPWRYEWDTSVAGAVSFDVQPIARNRLSHKIDVMFVVATAE